MSDDIVLPGEGEEKELTPIEILAQLIDELEGLQAADFNLWRGARLAEMKRLLEVGEEGEDFVFEPAPKSPVLSDWDAEGFSIEISNGCVAYRPVYEAAVRWEKSGDRILEYAATFMKRNRYMLPIFRLEEDPGFAIRYNKNLTCTPQPMIFGRSGYFNKAVFASFAEKTHSSWFGGDRVSFIGKDPIDDHYFPYAGLLQDKILDMFKDRYDTRGGAGYENFLRFAANALAEMDRGNLAKWEGYRPLPISMRFQRNLELELARSNPAY